MLHLNVEVLLLSFLACRLVGCLGLHLALLFARLLLLLQFVSTDCGIAFLIFLRVHEQASRCCLPIAEHRLARSRARVRRTDGETMVAILLKRR